MDVRNFDCEIQLGCEAAPAADPKAKAWQLSAPSQGEVELSFLVGRPNLSTVNASEGSGFKVALAAS